MGSVEKRIGQALLVVTVVLLAIPLVLAQDEDVAQPNPRGDCRDKPTCTISSCNLYITRDGLSLTEHTTGIEDHQTGNFASGEQSVTCSVSCLRDGKLKDECALNGKYYLLFHDPEMHSAKKCGPCNNLGNSPCSFSGNFIYQKAYCELDSYDPEDYSNRCAAFIENDTAKSIQDRVYFPGATGNPCCGNNPTEDMGNIVHDDGTNDRLCTRSGTGNARVDAGLKGDFGWIQPDVSGVPFKAFTVDRGSPPNRYQAISNGEDWFICGTKDGQHLAPIGSAVHRLRIFETFDGPDNDLGSVTGSVGSPTGGGGGGVGDIGDFDPQHPDNPAQPRPGDADGDGFFTIQFDPSLSNPDCNDNNASIHPGAFDRCGDGVDMACNDRDGVEVCDNIVTDFTDPNRRAARFICNTFDNAGAFAECCNGLSCSNSRTTARTIGEPLAIVKEFSEDCALGRNCVFSWIQLRSESKSIYQYPIFTDHSVNIDGISKSDNELTDWSTYDALEFYVRFTNSFIAELHILGQRTGANALKLSDYVPLRPPGTTQTIRIKDYVVNTPRLGEWLHVRIPLTGIVGLTKVSGIVFSAEKSEVAEFGRDFSLSDGRRVYNVIGIDRIFLSKRAVGGNNFNRFCSGSVFEESRLPNLWITDLDSPVLGADEQPAGRLACDATPGYGWTGTQCCGDDFGVNSDSETYGDTVRGCVAGNLLPENRRAGFVEYITDSSVVRRVCTSTTCDYPLPGADARSVQVSNTHANKYDMFFIEAGAVQQDAITSQRRATTATASVRATNIPLQILYSNMSLYGCDVDTFNDLDVLDDKQMCDVVGRFFCSGATAAISASHWSDEDTPTARSFTRNTTYELPGPATEYDAFFNYTDVGQERGCCSRDTCWNGATCVGSVSTTIPLNGPFVGTTFAQHRDSFTKDMGFHRDGFDQYVCTKTVEGANWTEAFYKERFDNQSSGLDSQGRCTSAGCSTATGLCLQDNQCWDGKSCVSTGFVNRDNYCSNGNWTSRTKFLGERFLQLVQDSENYVLYCDNFSNVLNHFEFNEALQFLTEGEQSTPGANNWCAVKFNDNRDNGKEKVVIGTSLNRPVSVRLQQFLRLVGVDACSTGGWDTNDGRFHRCTDGHLWYNNQSALIVYSKDGNGVPTFDTPSTRDLFFDFIQQPVETIIYIMRSILGLTVDDFGNRATAQFFNGLGDFSRTYLARNATKTVLGVQEELSSDRRFLSVEYQGFSADICAKTDKNGIQCKPTFNLSETRPRYYLTSFDTAGMGAWLEATGKLRLHQLDLSHVDVSAVIQEPAEFAPEESPFTTFGQMNLRAQAYDTIQSYYWDLHPRGGLLNGEYRGRLIKDVDLSGLGPGFHDVVLIALGYDGSRTISTRRICVNDPDDPVPNHDGPAPGRGQSDTIQNGCDADDDNDGIPDSGDGDTIEGNNPCKGGNTANCDDNCKSVPNGPRQGTCFDTHNPAVDGILLCQSDSQCPGDGKCSKSQEDSLSAGGQPKGKGKACDIDNDDDGVLNINDKWPDDPAVAHDFEPDGRPDDFNPGRSTADSTSSPRWRHCADGEQGAGCIDQDDDGDGLFDNDEEAGCRLNVDCDGDGLMDCEKSVYRTSSIVVDTDGDGLTDFEEVRGLLAVPSRPVDCSVVTPLHSNPTLLDTDNDRFETVILTDLNESSKPGQLGSNARNVDSDLDTMHDGWEVYYGFNPTSALDGGQTDTDGDGLLNTEEFMRKTNPLSRDTDNDGYEDKDEIDAGTDPLVQTPVRVMVVYPPAGRTLPEVRTINITGDKELRECHYATLNVPFNRMPINFSRKGEQMVAIASSRGGLNTFYIACRDVFNVIMTAPHVHQFTVDATDITILNTVPAGRVSDTALTFTVESSRSAVCRYSDSNPFVFMSGLAMIAVENSGGITHQARVSVRPKVDIQIAACRQNPDILALNNIRQCEAIASNNLGGCDGITDTELKENCRDRVVIAAGLHANDAAECNRNPDPDERQDCRDEVGADYPIDAQSECAGVEQNQHSGCIDDVAMQNAIAENSANYCTGLTDPFCIPAQAKKPALCLNQFCQQTVFDHSYTYGALCKDQFERLSRPEQIEFRLNRALEIS